MTRHANTDNHRYLENLVAERTQALAEQTHRLEGLLDAIPDLVFRLDRDGLFLDFRPAVGVDFYAPPEHFLGKKVRDVMPPEVSAATEAAVAEALRTGNVQEYEYRLVMHGRPLNYEARMMRIDANEVVAVIRDITARREALDALHQSAVELRALAAHLQNVREEERAALARELHDNFGQNLTGLQIDIMWLDQQMRSANPRDLPAWHDKVAAMVPLVEHLTEMTQTISSSLRLAVLDDLGLVAAVEWQASEFETHTGLPCEVSLPANDMELDPDIALAFFRILQEALANVMRHAQARQVKIRLHTLGSGLELEVQDNGRGFEAESIAGPKALGVLGMRERADAVGGTVDFLSEPGKGTTVRVRLAEAGVRDHKLEANHANTSCR